MTEEDEEFNRIEMEQRLREKALQALHDENVRLGLYEVYKERKSEILPTPSHPSNHAPHPTERYIPKTIWQPKE